MDRGNTELDFITHSKRGHLGLKNPIYTAALVHIPAIFSFSSSGEKPV
jgi:hypothetical protein